GDVVAVLLARLGLGQADAGDLRVGVDRARHAAVVDDGLVAHRILSRDLALAEGGVGELPVAGAVADGIDVRLGGAAVLVGGDARALVELDADLLQAEAFDERAASGGDEHQVALDRLVAVVLDAQPVAGVLDAVAAGVEVHVDAALAELPGHLLRGVSGLRRYT